jgi:hypothetical protein
LDPTFLLNLVEFGEQAIELPIDQPGEFQLHKVWISHNIFVFDHEQLAFRTTQLFDLLEYRANARRVKC